MGSARLSVVDTHYAAIHGRVRAHTIGHHLATFLPPPPIAIVDVGGGAGTLSIPMARRGYDLTILDPSPAMLEKARAALGSAREVVGTDCQDQHDIPFPRRRPTYDPTAYEPNPPR